MRTRCENKTTIIELWESSKDRTYWYSRKYYLRNAIDGKIDIFIIVHESNKAYLSSHSPDNRTRERANTNAREAAPADANVIATGNSLSSHSLETNARVTYIGIDSPSMRTQSSILLTPTSIKLQITCVFEQLVVVIKFAFSTHIIIAMQWSWMIAAVC